MSTQPAPLSLGEIDAALRKAFCSVSGRSCHDAEWTTAIKTEIARLGRRHGLYVCAGGVPRTETDPAAGADWGEWLFDVTLIRHARDDDDWFVFEDIVVAAESEWKRATHEMLNDFQKLLPVRAKWKLFICQASQRDVDPVFSMLQRHVCAYGANDIREQFYVAVYDDSIPAFHVRTGHFADGAFELVPRPRIERRP